MVRRNQVPWCPVRASLGEDVLVGCHVLVPMFPLRQIVAAELPFFSRIFETFLETLLLFIFADVKVEL